MKILEAVIKFGKAFSKLTGIGQVAVVGALLYVAFAVGSCTKDKDVDNLQVTVEQTKEHAKDLENKVKNLQDNVAKKETTITTLKFQISMRKQQQTTVRQQLATLEQQASQERTMVAQVPLPLTDSLIGGLKQQVAIADTIIKEQDMVINERDAQVKMLNNALYLSQQRGDTLQVALDKTLTAYNKKDKLFGKIPMPSRKTVAAIAFIGGAYVGVQAAR